MRNGTAVLPVVGPLFRYANLFTQVSGASSYELLAKDFTQAVENPDVKAIILNIDSPGGEVNGCAEFADMIHEARGVKPIIAYSSGDAASGTYWIAAAAADEIVVSKTSALGPIGVVAVYRGNKDEDAVEVVSSQSPYMRVDPPKQNLVQPFLHLLAHEIMEQPQLCSPHPHSIAQRYLSGHENEK